jgi:hypothetical protein
MSRSRLLLLVLTTALALVLGFWSFTPAEALKVVQWGGYWMILVAAIAFGVALVRSLRDVGPELRAWRGWWAPALVAVLGAGFLHLHEPHEFKIVADEVVLQMTARQMHFAREVSVVVRGGDYAGYFTPLATYVDKRPLFYPFLVSLVHDLTGFRIANAFFLNGALSLVFTLLLLLIGRRIGGWGAGVALVLLAITIPLLAQNACGAGFELLNLVMIALTIWLGMRAADQPENDDRLGAFVLSGVLLAQVRYESALFVLPVAAAVVYLWWRQRAVRLPWSLLVAPLLLVTLPLVLNVFKVSASAWQLNDVPGSDEPFAFRYFYDNVGHALNFFLSVDGSQGNSLLVAVAGALAVGFFVLVLYREHRRLFREQPASAVLAIFLIGLLVHTLMMLCYFWGHWDDPVIRRLSLPAHLLLLLSIAIVWPRLVGHPRRWGFLSGAALMYLVGFTVPHNALHRFTQENFAARATNWLNGRIRKLGSESVLAIDQASGLLWFLNGKSSTMVEAVARKPEGFLLHFRNRSFAHFLVVQRVTPQLATGRREIEVKDDLGDGVKLETIEERDFSPLYHVRLSRIVGIDEAKFKAWAKHYVEAESKPPPRVSPGKSAALSKRADDELLEWLRQLP